mgnify:CR=1 FL=1
MTLEGGKMGIFDKLFGEKSRDSKKEKNREVYRIDSEEKAKKALKAFSLFARSESGKLTEREKEKLRKLEEDDEGLYKRTKAIYLLMFGEEEDLKKIWIQEGDTLLYGEAVKDFQESLVSEKLLLSISLMEGGKPKAIAELLNLMNRMPPIWLNEE